MSYKDLTIIDFMDTILGKRKSQDIEPTISEFDMSDYLENKTSTFSRDKFDTLIKVIRDHIKSAEYKYKEFKEAEESDDDIYRIKMTGFFAPKFDYEKLFKFSEIAEQEYKRVTESNYAENEKTISEIKPTNIQIFENKSYYDLTLTEFLDLITNTEHIYEFKMLKYSEIEDEEEIVKGTLDQIINVILQTDASPEWKQNFLKPILKKKEVTYSKELTDIEIYNYLERLTGNFDKEKSKIILNDIRVIKSKFYANLEYKSTEIYENNKWEIPYHEIIPNTWTDLKHEGRTVLFQDHDKMINKTHPGIFYELNKCINTLERKLNDNTIKDKQPKQTGTPTPKQPLTFAGLFKPEFQNCLNVLFEWLRLNDITDKNNNWREWEPGRVEKNETSKLYYYLKQNNVLEEYDTPPALKCFNEKFGIEVYKDNETPITKRFVSLRTLTRSENTATKTKLLEKFEIVFQKWIEEIPLK